jgi:hypothetical protein
MLTYADVCCRSTEEAGAHITFQSIPLKMRPTTGSSANDSGNDSGKRLLRRMTGSYTVTPALVPTTLVPSQTVTATAAHTLATPAHTKGPPTSNTPHTPNQSTVRFQLHVHLRSQPPPPSQLRSPPHFLSRARFLSLSEVFWLVAHSESLPLFVQGALAGLVVDRATCGLKTYLESRHSSRLAPTRLHNAFSLKQA